MFTKAQALAMTQMMAVIFSKLPAQEDYYDFRELSETYDFIIVGGGSAGALLANRLSAKPSLRVLLLEAGGVEDTLSAVPLMATLQLQGPKDWAYWTEPQRNACLALTDQRSPWPRGKVLGGCSALNFMLYVRGHPEDYDRWSRVHGATGWDWESVLPFFKRFEDQTDIRLASSGTVLSPHIMTASHLEGVATCIFKTCLMYLALKIAAGMYGLGGELTVSMPASNTPLARTFLDAGKELGYDIVDYNAGRGHMIGFSTFQTTMRNGSRWSTASAFLRPVSGPAGRKNLHISLHSTANRVLFEGMRAIGVEFVKNGRIRTAFATREVILSAGVIESPHLLLLSGIGPKEQLQEFGIPVIADLPGVGENLAEHLYPGGLSASIERKMDIDVTPFAGPLLFYSRNKGPWTIPGGVETVAFVQTEPANGTAADVPDIEILLFSMSPASSEGERFMLDIGLDPKAYDDYYKPLRGSHGYNLVPVLLHPKSRGVLRLKSADPRIPPAIDPRYLSHPDDIRVIVKGMKASARIAETKAFKQLGSRLWPRHFPGCERHLLWSDEYLECLARHYTTALWHPSGTCKMGNASDAVVDPQLRVLGGVQGLRVVDASVMPEPLSAHLNGPTMMIAEKAAHMILQDLEGEDNQPLVPDATAVV
ncbi:glucose dehydrogenase [FAD, quinone] [Dermacentor silvarum]|uniref:glucose dehydrogenase [FAD, quinone] n=1 Tax=Dermacentor silvarum TaxID=543639 RepID=UPI00210145ED|nr:glucose dehydrogenase [FAD, quinone] [Dermacentor silvarum]